MATTKHARHRKPPTTPESQEHSVREVPESSKLALRKAMALESVPAIQFDDLLWIMAQESRGQVDIRNIHSSARGLFQLLRNNYGLNPHGVESFGNDIEECQGGIRYIVNRYRSARVARQFWQKHHWY